MFITGFMLALTALLLLWKMPKLHQRAVRHPALGDVSITVGVVALGLFTATFSGLMAGAVAGIMLSIYLTVMSKAHRYRRERYERHINQEAWPLPRPTLPRVSVPRLRHLREAARQTTWAERLAQEVEAETAAKALPSPKSRRELLNLIDKRIEERLSEHSNR